MRIIKLTEESKNDLLVSLLKRSPAQYGEYEDRVAAILDDIKANGDEALFRYTKNFDKCDINESNILVTKEEIEEAYTKVDPELVGVITRAAASIRKFHEKQKRNSWFDEEEGVIVGQRIIPMAAVGIYVPGGKAAYPSSLLMNAIPAQVAGVKRIAMTTPPGADGKVPPVTLVAADIAGVTEIYKCGGAQAIASLAYGTKSIKKVDKICGPGNIYVALAKRRVYGNVSIDSIAGPSEILVLADETANARFVAADLLSQAEHDELASAILITTSEELANQVSIEVDKFTEVLERKDIITKSLENFGYIFVAENKDDAIDAVNEIASEHLEIVTADPFADMTRVKNAGAIFLGQYSSEPLGDYYAGPNHILPTNGTSKFFSPLNLDDFVKKTSVISYTKDALSKVSDDVIAFAKSEGLTAHANSIAVRFDK